MTDDTIDNVTNGENEQPNVPDNGTQRTRTHIHKHAYDEDLSPPDAVCVCVNPTVLSVLDAQWFEPLTYLLLDQTLWEVRYELTVMSLVMSLSFSCFPPSSFFPRKRLRAYVEIQSVSFVVLDTTLRTTVYTTNLIIHRRVPSCVDVVCVLFTALSLIVGRRTSKWHHVGES